MVPAEDRFSTEAHAPANRGNLAIANTEQRRADLTLALVVVVRAKRRHPVGTTKQQTWQTLKDHQRGPTKQASDIFSFALLFNMPIFRMGMHKSSACPTKHNMPARDPRTHQILKVLFARLHTRVCEPWPITAWDHPGPPEDEARHEGELNANGVEVVKEE